MNTFNPKQIEQVEIQTNVLPFSVYIDTENRDWLIVTIDGQPFYFESYAEYIPFIKGFKGALILAEQARQ